MEETTRGSMPRTNPIVRQPRLEVVPDDTDLEPALAELEDELLGDELEEEVEEDRPILWAWRLIWWTAAIAGVGTAVAWLLIMVRIVGEVWTSFP